MSSYHASCHHIIACMISYHINQPPLLVSYFVVVGTCLNRTKRIGPIEVEQLTERFHNFALRFENASLLLVHKQVTSEQPEFFDNKSSCRRTAITRKLVFEPLHQFRVFESQPELRSACTRKLLFSGYLQARVQVLDLFDILVCIWRVCVKCKNKSKFTCTNTLA